MYMHYYSLYIVLVSSIIVLSQEMQISRPQSGKSDNQPSMLEI